MKYQRLALMTWLAAALVPASLAQIETDFAWIQGSPGTNFAVFHSDLNRDTGELSAWGDYQGLVGDLTAVELRDASGGVLTTLAFTAPRTGFAYGSTLLSSATVDSTFADGTTVHFLTTSSPHGEMDGNFDYPSTSYRTLTMDAGQVVGTAGAAGATGSMNLSLQGDKSFALVISTTGITSVQTGLELYTGAWRGENGPLALDLSPFNISLSPDTYYAQIPAGVLSPSQWSDIREGFAYVLVRTQSHPSGALRGQASLGLVSETYCSGRSSATSAIGGKVTLTGSPRIMDHHVELRGQFFPIGVPVLPIVGTGSEHSFLPGQSRGILCLGGAPITRLVSELATGQGIGVFTRTLDLAQLMGPVTVTPGEMLRFQCWYRDNENGQLTSNFSDAVGVRVR